MAGRLSIQVNDTSGSPVAGAAITFAPLRVAVPESVVWPPLFGGTTDITGLYARQFLLSKLGVWTYTASASAPGYVSATAEMLIGNEFDANATITLTPAPLGEAVVAVGVPPLVSVGNPPGIELVGLPYTPYTYVDTIVTAAGGSSVSIETGVNPSGGCSISLRDRFQIDPRPTLVTGELTPLQDTAMSRDYTVTCYLVSGASRRSIASWSTTALLLDTANIPTLVGKWLPASSLVVSRGYYADVAVLLPAGTYTLRRNAGTGFSPLTDVAITTNGKTITRIRIPSVTDTTLTIWVMQGATRITPDLTISYR